MHLIDHLHGETFIHHLDPRLRVVFGLAFAVLTAVSLRPEVIALAAGLAVLGVFLAKIGWPVLRGRLTEVNIFMLMIVILLPFSAGGEPLFSLGPLAYSRAGLITAIKVTVKANAIVLMLTVMLSTMEVVTLGHALSHLRVPDKLIHLFMFTVRYVDVLHHEYLRLGRAMKARCFRPGLNGHTYRTIGHLVAMLLINSLDRSERILNAMKCRGFKGRFYLLDHFHTHRADLYFAATAVGLLALLAGWEWS